MQAKIKLSARLQTVASFVSKGANFADIGADHGYLACFICQNDVHARAIASEVREGPFLRTEENVAAYQLTDKIDVRIGDGLSVITDDDPTTEIIIAGMGGSLMTQILSANQKILEKINKIIVQPNSKEDRLRKFFFEHDYVLTEEVILKENKHIYEVLVAKKNSTLTTPYKEHVMMEKQFLFGPYLMKERSPIFKEKWQQEKNKINNILTQIEHKDDNMEKINSFNRQLKWIEEVLR